MQVLQNYRVSLFFFFADSIKAASKLALCGADGG